MPKITVHSALGWPHCDCCDPASGCAITRNHPVQWDMCSCRSRGPGPTRLGREHLQTTRYHVTDPKALRALGDPFKTPWGHSTSPAVVGGRVYYRDRQNLSCVDLRANAAEPRRPKPWSGEGAKTDWMAKLKAPFLRDRQKAAKLLGRGAGSPEIAASMVELLKGGPWLAQQPAAYVLRHVWDADAKYGPVLEASAREALRPGAKILMCAAGAGLTGGAVVLGL